MTTSLPVLSQSRTSVQGISSRLNLCLSATDASPLILLLSEIRTRGLPHHQLGGETNPLVYCFPCQQPQQHPGCRGADLVGGQGYRGEGRPHEGCHGGV